MKCSRCGHLELVRDDVEAWLRQMEEDRKAADAEFRRINRMDRILTVCTWVICALSVVVVRIVVWKAGRC